jgi:hypothetical protein
MLFESSVLLRCPSPLKCTKRHSKIAEKHGYNIYDALVVSAALEAGCATLFSIPKTFTMARQLMDNSPFEIPSLAQSQIEMAREYKERTAS